MSKVKALQCSDIGKVELVEFPMPTVAEDALLIKVLTCGICGTDLHGIKGMRSQIKLPIIPGHEMIGGGPRHRRQGLAWNQGVR